MSNYFDDKISFMEPTVTQHGSRMVMTNVVKSKIKQFINFDTRFSDNTNTEYTFHLPERITNVKQIKIAQIEIPVSFYNISAILQNHVIRLKNSKTAEFYYIIIDDGYYTQNTFISKMQTLLLPYSITFNVDSNNKAYFTNLSTIPIFIDFIINYSNTLFNIGQENYLQSLLGFNLTEYTLTTTIKAEKFFNINNLRYIFLTMEEYTNSSYNGFIAMLKNSTVNKKIITRIPIDYTLYPFGTILQPELINCVRKYHGPVDIQKFKIQLINEYGLPVYLNGNNFSFVLEIEMEE